MADLSLNADAKIYVDLELIEKLIVHSHAFANTSLRADSLMLFYAKQITFLDLKPHSFARLTLEGRSRAQVYLEELAASICVQRHVFAQMRLLGAGASFNFSVINSRNVQIMRDTFSNLTIDARSGAKLFIGVFNMPSIFLIQQNEDFYQRFLRQRLNYLWSSSQTWVF